MEGVSSGVHPRSKLNLQRDSATDPTVSGIQKFWKMLMGISKSRIQHCWAHSSGSGQESTEKPLDSALSAFTDHPCAQKTFMQAGLINKVRISLSALSPLLCYEGPDLARMSVHAHTHTHTHTVYSSWKHPTSSILGICHRHSANEHTRLLYRITADPTSVPLKVKSWSKECSTLPRPEEQLNEGELGNRIITWLLLPR